MQMRNHLVTEHEQILFSTEMPNFASAIHVKIKHVTSLLKTPNPTGPVISPHPVYNKLRTTVGIISASGIGID